MSDLAFALLPAQRERSISRSNAGIQPRSMAAARGRQRHAVPPSSAAPPAPASPPSSLLALSLLLSPPPGVHRRQEAPHPPGGPRNLEGSRAAPESVYWRKCGAGCALPVLWRLHPAALQVKTAKSKETRSQLVELGCMFAHLLGACLPAMRASGGSSSALHAAAGCGLFQEQ